MAANNYISGGQVFLHKVRMLMQVLNRTINVAVLAGIIFTILCYVPELLKPDWHAFAGYRKAVLAAGFDRGTNSLRRIIGKSDNHVTMVSASTGRKVYGNAIDPRKVIKIQAFREADNHVMNLFYRMFIFALLSTVAASVLVVMLWNRFGKNLKEDRKIKGGRILSASEVRNTLKSMNMDSHFILGGMPLVRDSETRHMLISGATGSGKTNFMDNLLPQVEGRHQPAVVIDQTGEMISKYYDGTRGDIIFNPLDDRGMNWDFWTDCFATSTRVNGINDRLEKFARILFSFNRKSAGFNSDPFWENSAEAVFTSCAEYLYSAGEQSIDRLQEMLQNQSLEHLSTLLRDTPANRYLTGANRVTASSILSVLGVSTRPLQYLRKEGGGFSLVEYLRGVAEGKKAWLFLATKPGQRELTLPLLACLTELAVSLLMEQGIRREQRLWFVIDELPGLGKLPSLSLLMAEGRKYGACVLAAMQSVSQLYDSYGEHAGSTIFGQFGSKFFFRNDEPRIARMITDLCGSELVSRQQKNTSFGANELRDGISYTEQEKHKNLVEYNDIASLKVGECLALLPMPEARLARLTLPKVDIALKNEGFMPHTGLPGSRDVNGNSTGPVNTADGIHPDSTDPDNNGIRLATQDEHELNIQEI